MDSSFLTFLYHRQRHSTVGRVISPSQRPLTTHNTRNRQMYMPPAGFEPIISAGERPQTYALDRAGIGTEPSSYSRYYCYYYYYYLPFIKYTTRKT